MQSNIQKNSITGHTAHSLTNQQSFTHYRTATVSQVLTKATAFGFRVKDITLGLKTSWVNPNNQQSSMNSDSKSLILEETKKGYTEQKSRKIAKQYFPKKIAKHFIEPSGEKLNDGLSLIHKAYKYDDFIQAHAENMNIKSETFPDFLKRLEGVEGEYSQFLKIIANGIKTIDDNKPKYNGLHLMALWVEFSNATAMHDANKATLFENEEVFKWEEFEGQLLQQPYSGKRKASRLYKAGELSTSHKKTKPDHSGTSNATAFTGYATSSDQITSDDTTDSNEITSCGPTGNPQINPSCSREKNCNEETGGKRTNLIDKYRTEGKSEKEIITPVEKVKYLTDQALDNVIKLQKQQSESNKTAISEDEKRNMIKRAVALQSAINGLKTSAIKKH